MSSNILYLPKNISTEDSLLLQWIAYTDFHNEKIYKNYTGTPLSSAAMQSVVRDGNYAQIIDAAIQNGQIRLTKDFVRSGNGKAGQCREYQVVDRDFRKVEVSESVMNRFVKFSIKMNIQLGGKRKFTINEEIKKLQLPFSTDIPEWIRDSVSEGKEMITTNDRIWSPISNLSKLIRRSIKFNGQSLVEVDISNSQPKLLVQHFQSVLPYEELSNLKMYLDSGTFYKLATDSLDMEWNADTKRKSKSAFFTAIHSKGNKFLYLPERIDGKTSLLSAWRVILNTFFPVLTNLIIEGKNRNGDNYYANLLQTKEAAIIDSVRSKLGSRIKYSIYDSVAVLPCYVDQVEKMMSAATSISLDTTSYTTPIGYTSEVKQSKIDQWYTYFKSKLMSSLPLLQPVFTYSHRKKKVKTRKPLKQMTILNFV